VQCSTVALHLLIYLLHGAESFLRSQPVLSQSRNPPHCVEPEGSLPHSQMPATCPYPEPARSSLYHHFLKIHLNIILPSTSGSFKGLFPSGFPPKPCIHLSPIRATCPDHLILDFITRTVCGEQYRSLSSSLCSFFHCLVTPSLLCPNILLSTLSSNPLSLRSSLNTSDQVLHPYKTTGKIIFPYVVAHIFNP